MLAPFALVWAHDSLIYVFASSAISAIFSIQLFHAFSLVIQEPHLTYILMHFALSCLVLCITGFCLALFSYLPLVYHSSPS